MSSYYTRVLSELICVIGWVSSHVEQNKCPLRVLEYLNWTWSLFPSHLCQLKLFVYLDPHCWFLNA